jgi:hypothetical protein
MSARRSRATGRWRQHPDTRYTVEASRTMPGRYAVYDWETGGLARDHSGRPVFADTRAAAERYVHESGNPAFTGFRRDRLLREPSRRARRRGRR